MSDRRDDPDRRDDRTRAGRDEPLGDLAAEVRERTGTTRGERDDPPTREGPLADVASAVDERRRRKRDETDAFESVDVGDIDGEKLWEELAERGDEGEGATAAVSADAPTAESADATEVAETTSPDPAASASDRDVRTIPTETCHGCPHFGDPPDLACTHEGTDILAMPDTGHFRVADCPMVVDGEEDISGIGVGSDDE
ncbi:hypothetical protein [Halorussus caseinilyticus]|uniref:DUF8135 domain-containing protein n=1 Tax=Halorussus caseinilyticus TaxID=3034025 RepID=A0ABD5WTG6_9EURY|nr:hypothetical protein [Halorussus sp. DT72]